MQPSTGASSDVLWKIWEEAQLWTQEWISDLLAENTKFFVISLERDNPVKITVLNVACRTKKCQLNALIFLSLEKSQ